MQNDNERELKQNFLRENILEKEYNAEEFLKFITDIKGEDAGDVDVWTFEELKQVVSNFISNQVHGIENVTQGNNSHLYGSDDEKEKKKEM
jgi:hypothetical protein